MGDADIPRCGRPTGSGKPCRRVLTLHQSACRTHATAEDDAYYRGHQAGWDAGSKAGEESGRMAERLAAEFARREAERAGRLQMTTAEGWQIVQVGRYAYAWDGAPLQVGDRVLLPANWLVSHPTAATVTGFGSDYDGTLAKILRKIPADEPAIA